VREGSASDFGFAKSIDRLPFSRLGDGRQAFSAHAMTSGGLISDCGCVDDEKIKKGSKVDAFEV
jgi:hypothetical protein